MLRWCAYCQKFLGESEPLQNYAVSHGMCQACKNKGADKLDAEMDTLKKLADFQRQLMDAGMKQDMVAAKKLIDQALRDGLQSIDLLMGIIAPSLWQIGDMWESGKITYKDEHRFTAFVDAIVREMEAKKMFAHAKEKEKLGDVDILLVNAPQNYHFLGVYALNLWLHSQNIHSVAINSPQTTTELLSHIKQYRPRFVGFSVALAEQVPLTLKLCEQIQNDLRKDPPAFLFGGSAIKRGVTLDSQNIACLYDINELLRLLQK